MTTEDIRFARTRMLLGDQGVAQLQAAHVAVFGVGGVGGYCVEALARSGVGVLTLIDADTVGPSNINRQIIALESTVGRSKVQVMKERIADIAPSCKVNTHQVFFLPENASEFDFSSFDYVVDCVDTVSAKLAIIGASKSVDVPVISSMGAGNKLDPTRFEIADISQTSVDPLARVMRRELRRRGINGVKVVYSTEQPVCERNQAEGLDEAPCAERAKPVAGSIAFVPSVAGLILASEVVKDIACKKG